MPIGASHRENICGMANARKSAWLAAIKALKNSIALKSEPIIKSGDVCEIPSTSCSKFNNNWSLDVREYAEKKRGKNLMATNTAIIAVTDSKHGYKMVIGCWHIRQRPFNHNHEKTGMLSYQDIILLQ